MDLALLTSVLIEAATKASKLLLSRYGTDLDVHTKSNAQDYVTEVDLLSQQLITEHIRAAMQKFGIADNEFGFIGEESLARNTTAPHLFIIDPLDGTSSYVLKRENGAFAVSIAYAYERELLMGVIAEPKSDNIFYAQKGKGAWKISGNDAKHVQTSLRISPNAISALFYNASTEERVNEKIMKKVDTLFASGLFSSKSRSRSCVSTAMRVVENSCQMAVNGKAYIWDIAAIAVVIEEAGGVLADWSGSPITFSWEVTQEQYQVLITSQKVLKGLGVA